MRATRNAHREARGRSAIPSMPPAGSARGFTLVEALVTLLVLTLILLSLAQLIGTGMLADRGSEDLTTATSLGSAKLEELRSGDYFDLITGGDLDGNVDGYFDEPDVDDDGDADFVRRWEITDQAGGRTIEVRVIAARKAIGQEKEATLATVVGEPS